MLAGSMGAFRAAVNLLFLPPADAVRLLQLSYYGICECQLCVSSGWRVGNGKEKDLKTNTKFFKVYNAIKAIFDKNNSRKDTMLLQLCVIKSF